jgi:hypothetical protein
MPVTPTKTWEYNINNAESAVDITTRNDQLMLLLKRLLTDTGGVQAVDDANSNISLTSPFVVVASSNDVVADSNDNWNSTADLVWGSSGSWIHLRQVDYFGVGDHLNLLIFLGTTISVHQLARVQWARGADGWQNDGSITSPPTPEVGVTVITTRDGTTTTGDVLVSDEMWGSDATNNQAVLHLRISDDGQCGAWFVCVGGAVVASHGWQRGEEDQARTNDFFVWGLGADLNSEIFTWVSNFNTLRTMRSLDNGDVEFGAFVGTPCFSGTEDQHASFNHGGTGNRFLAQAPLYDDAQFSCFGVLTDMWWNSTQEATGDGSPTTGNVTKRTVGQFAIPWPSGATMQVA